MKKVIIYLSLFLSILSGYAHQTIEPNNRKFNTGDLTKFEVDDTGGKGRIKPENVIARKKAIQKGRIEKFQFQVSKIYPGTERDVTVYIPQQINPLSPLCLYICQDGYASRLTDAMDSLINNNEIPQMVGIFISPGTIHSTHIPTVSRSNRCYEYDNLGNDYCRFLLEEIVPYVSRKYNLNISENSNDRCINGTSSGGICAFNVAWERPDAFSRVYCSSGSFVAFRGGNSLPVLLRKYEAKAIRIFMSVSLHDMENSGGNWWLANNELERALAFSTYDYKYLWYEEGWHCYRYDEDFSTAMRWLWRDYPTAITAGLGPPRVQDILIPSEKWVLAYAGLSDAGSLTVNSKGEVFICDALANCIYKIGTDSKTILFLKNGEQICGLTTGVDDCLYGISKVTGKLIVFDNVGKSKVIAKNVHGSSIIATSDGGFYIAGQNAGVGTIWYVNKSGKVRIVDTGLKNPTGLAISVDKWQLAVADGGSHWVYLFTIGYDGALLNKEHFYWLHVPDNEDNSGAGGVFYDETNHLFVATFMGIQTNDLYGHNKCIIPTPEKGAFDICMGGQGFNTMFATCGNKVYMRKVKVKGHYGFHPTIIPPSHDL